MRPISHASRLSLLSLALLAGCGQGGGRGGLPPPERIVLAAPVSVPMESFEGRPIVRASVNGRGPYRFILDSGAAGSVLSDALARDLGLPALGKARMTRPGSAGKVAALLTRANTIEIGTLRLEGVGMVAADFSLIQKRAPDVMGALSATMLDGLLVSYDYPAGRISFWRGELPVADGRTTFAWPESERLPSLPARIGGQTVALDIDTGNPGGFTVGKAAADRLAWTTAPVETAPLKMLDTQSRQFLGRLKGSITIGAYTFDNPEVRSNEGVANLIGYQVLKEFVLTIDSHNRRFQLVRPLPEH